ncbi:MAG: orotate phosphoribosyltransferase [Candidatus Omnitrophica bacterium]|nr:orotate phosphoribosyltransferase [Candidatus Omnitrophota bacterium]
MNEKDLRRDLFKLIYNEAFFKKRILLSSGKISSFYVDVRKISLKSKGAFLIANLLWKELEKEKFSAVGGPTLGADPILSSLAYHAHIKRKCLKTFIVRKSAKKHGRAKIIEGPNIPKNSKVIIIDDVATTGKSLVEAIQKLRTLKINVTKAFVVVDREEGAGEALSGYGCPLQSLFKLREFTE